MMDDLPSFFRYAEESLRNSFKDPLNVYEFEVMSRAVLGSCDLLRLTYCSSAAHFHVI